MLDDIGSPNAQELGQLMHVSTATARRWIKADQAPRPVMLAVFWLTRWGMSLVDAEAVNAARLHAAVAASLRLEIEVLKAKLQRLGTIGHFGAANDPAPEAPSIPRVQRATELRGGIDFGDSPTGGQTVRPNGREIKQPRGFHHG